MSTSFYQSKDPVIDVPEGFEPFYQSEDLVINVPEDFELTPDCCIYKVPTSLRRRKEEAYTPKLISIGPFHHGSKNLVEMEKQKLRYLRKFCERTSKDTLEILLSFIKMEERRIRSFYAKSFSEAEFESSKFIKLILCDAVFIIELFLRVWEEKVDFLLTSDLKLDLSLLENQLPFFVLEGLYEGASLPFDCPPFLKLACKYFDFDPDSAFEEEIKHFTHLIRWQLVGKHPSSKSSSKKSGLWMDDLCSATMLHEAGVKFRAVRESVPLDINFERKTLHMRPLILHPYTEPHLRNIMALEQCHYQDEPYVCDYVVLMDHLINTDKDVGLLVKEGVLINRMGSTTAVADMINNLSQGLEIVSLCYENIAEGLIKCHQSSWNRATATLKQVYFNNLLRGTLSVAAFLVVVLTIIQTVTAILQLGSPTK